MCFVVNCMKKITLFCLLFFPLMGNTTELTSNNLDDYFQEKGVQMSTEQRVRRSASSAESVIDQDVRPVRISYATEKESSIRNNRPSEVVSIGMKRDTALSMSGTFLEGKVENDDPCSSSHNVGDVSNRWCHAYFSELAHNILKQNGFNEYIAHAGGLLVFMLKELGDVNYDWSDVNTAPIGGNINETTASYVTLMLDGSFHLYISKKFQL